MRALFPRQVVVATLLAAATVVPGTGSPPSTVMAQWSSPATGKQPVLEVFSAVTGKPVRQALRLPGWPSTVSGPFPGPAGSLWYSVATGPKARCANCMESVPLPGTCRSDLVRSGPSTGKARTVLALPPTELARDAVPSPDGSRVVYMAEDCTAYAAWHYVVSDLRTGASVLIGATTAPCHAASDPSWSADGRALTFTWSPAAPGARAPVGGAVEACPQWGRGEIAVVPTDRPGPITAAELHRAPKGCSYVASAFDATGILAVKDCGGQGDWLGTATLVQLSRAFVPTAELPLPPRPDGLTLSVAAGGHDVLVDEYQAAATGSHGNIPTEWLLAFDGHRLRTVVRDHTGVDSLTFALWR